MPNLLKKINNIIFVFIITGLALNYSLQSNNSTTAVSSEDSLKAEKDLIYRIDRLLANKGIKNAKYSIAVYSLDTKKYLYERNSDRFIIPASNTKIITTYSALMMLGQEGQLKTTIYSDVPVDKDGVINGNLYIVGGGDALLSLYDIENLADMVSSHGVKEIKGNIYADASFFDNNTERVSYSGDRDVVEPLQPICGLSIEKNIATILVRGASAPNKKVFAQVFPASDAFRLLINAKVGGGNVKSNTPEQKQSKANKRKVNGVKSHHRTNSHKKISSIQAQSSYRVGDYLINRKPRIKRAGSAGGISISTRLGDDGMQEFIINGSLPKNRTVSYTHFIKNPPLVCAGVLKNRLEAGGIKIDGTIGVQKFGFVQNNSANLLLAQTGRNLIDVIYDLNKNSDNFLAENVFKLIGALSDGSENCAEKAKIKISEILQKNNIFSDGLKLNDGSGLSRRNLVSARTLVDILVNIKQQPFSSGFESTLPIAGIDGTLRHRFIGSLAFNNLHAKTGTHNNVSSLSGYVTSADGEKFVFSIIFNGSGSFKKTENLIGDEIANFSYIQQKNN